MIEQMCKIDCAVPRQSAPAFFAWLQRDGRVQLIKTQTPPEEAPLAERLAALREKLRTIVETLGDAAASESADVPLNWNREDTFLGFIAQLEESVEQFRSRLAASQKKIADLADEKRAAELLHRQLGGSLFKDIPQHEDRLWRVPSSLWPIAHKRLAEHADGEIASHVHAAPEEEDGYTLVELSVPEAETGCADEIMKTVGALPWPEDAPPAETEARLCEKIDGLTRLIDSEEQALAKMKRDWAPRQSALYDAVDRICQQYQAFCHCEQIGSVVLVQGWIAGTQLENFMAALSKKLPEVAVYSRPPEEEEFHSVPTALKHSSFFAPFALFLKLVRPPAYGTVDPTVLIGIFFPFFAGCIIGDAGYAVVMLLIMFFLRARSKNALVRDVAFILICVSAWSVLWGFAFGEFFGDTGHRLFHMEPLWVERSQAVLPVLMFSVALGLAHVLIGMLAGLLQSLAAGHKRHAAEKLGAILVIVAAVTALMALRQLLPSAAFPAGIALLIVGIILLAVGGGIGGLIESMSSFGHILSYVRIGAIGLSSAILAVAASKFIDVLGLSVLGIFIALAIHLLNFVLAFAESGLHAARLHYVEFMGNFYEADGTPWRPFTYRREHSWKKDS